MITDAVTELYDRIVDRNLLVRRINITANRLVDESSVRKEEVYEQLDLFTDYETQGKSRKRKRLRWIVKNVCRKRCSVSKEIWKKCCIERDESSGRCNRQGQK